MKNNSLSYVSTNLSDLYLVSCRDVRYDIHIKTMIGLSLFPLWLVVGSCFIYYLYLCTHTGVQYSFHIISYSCRLPVPWQMPLIEQELLSTWVHPAFNRVRVVQSFIFFIVFYRSVFQFVLQFTMSDCPFGIFKFFFCDINIKLNYPYLNWQCFSPG